MQCAENPSRECPNIKVNECAVECTYLWRSEKGFSQCVSGKYFKPSMLFYETL